MTKNPNPNLDLDRDRDPDPANDNGGNGAVAPAPAGGALATLTALGTVLNKVDTGGVAGRSGLPLMSFKARDNNGTWMFGQKKTVVEDGSKWAVNPESFKWGFICFDENNKPTERLVSVSQPKPNVADLPDTGFEWQEEWAVNMKCIIGADAGVEVIFKASTVGGIQAVTGLIDIIRDRLNSGQHDGKIAPIVVPEKGSYPHAQYGKTWYPVLTIIDWMSLDGPATAPTSPPPPPTPPASTSADEQPRRRRAG